MIRLSAGALPQHLTLSPKAAKAIITTSNNKERSRSAQHPSPHLAPISLSSWTTNNIQLFWTMADSLIKPDPDAPGASPGVFTDDDIYEDAGDLEFNPDPAFQKLYLARVPRYVWEAWSTLDDDAEIRIGTIRQSQEVGPDGQPQVLLPSSKPYGTWLLTIADVTIHAFIL
jgi:hypothetical protein